LQKKQPNTILLIPKILAMQSEAIEQLQAGQFWFRQKGLNSALGALRGVREHSEPTPFWGQRKTPQAVVAWGICFPLFIILQHRPCPKDLKNL